MKFHIKHLYKNFLQFKKILLTIKTMKYSATSSNIKKIYKVLLLTTENFHISHSSLWSSNLSFYAIFSFIPILAIVMGIASFLGFNNLIKSSLLGVLPLDNELYTYISSFTNAVLNRTKEGVVTIVALISLAWAIIKIFSLLEHSFNAIWKVESSRNIFRKITDYISIVILFPFAVIASNILSSFITNKLKELTNNIGFFASLSLNLLRFSDLVTLCVLLGIIYMIIPNTKIKFQSAMLAGIFSGLLIFLLQFAFYKFQRFLFQYDSIYGSFAILPVFLIWQRFFWSIVLSGCHLSFIYQNYYKYDYSLSPIKLSFHEKKLISLMIMYIYTHNFKKYKKPISTNEIAYNLKLSINLTQNLIDHLVKIKLLTKIESDNELQIYQPAFDTDELDIKTITETLENSGINHLLEFNDDDFYKTIQDEFISLIKTNSNKKLEEI